jgi:hypothetical protein
MKFNNKFCQLTAMLLFTSLMTSCYSTYHVYKGNVHQQSIGKTKNEILRSYGVPDKTTDDGAGGEVLAYEKYFQTTITNSGAATLGNSSTVGSAVYGNAGIIGGSQTLGSSYTSIRSTSHTSIDKTYCYLYLNPSKIVYDFKTNTGGIYDSKKCFDVRKSYTFVGISFLVYPVFVVSLPWTIIAHVKAKKKGNICK